ncbi:hypothetical protein [Gordonia sihwensis]|uniref:hypothetical protein n=1 Tax=Gordonia sihwensis TaxID=173559 RepID=UPI003D996870
MANHLLTANSRPGAIVGYHHAARHHRESIRSLGLLIREPQQQRSRAEECGHPAGVYLFWSPEDATALGDGDVYAVDLTGLDTRHLVGESEMTCYVTADIGPERITLVGRPVAR